MGKLVWDVVIAAPVDVVLNVMSFLYVYSSIDWIVVLEVADGLVFHVPAVVFQMIMPATAIIAMKTRAWITYFFVWLTRFEILLIVFLKIRLSALNQGHRRI